MRAYLYVLPPQSDSLQALFSCAQDWSEREKRPLISTNILRTERGKPYFETGYPHFSISHTQGVWICALSEQNVGLDVQNHRSCKAEQLARRFFHPDEIAYLQQRNWTPFFDVWSAKESYVKFTGEGIGEGFSAFSVINAEQKIANCGNALLTCLVWKEGYSLCLATESVPELIWIKKG